MADETNDARVGVAEQAESSPEAQVAPSEQAAKEPVDLDALGCQIEAALLTTDRPLPPAKLSELFDIAGNKAIAQAISQLNKLYESTGRTFRIEKVADGYQLLTLPEYAQVLTALHKTRQQTKLSPAALETLAIVAYKQPILRVDVEAIRGVACGEVLRSLMERRLVKIVGRAEELGRPMLYGTTKAFLEVFGLSSLKDLPQVEELKPPKPQTTAKE